jgi:2-desacetyl-2-hydroxyethyl bacteriochlorophyllide A dehydrogenase
LIGAEVNALMESRHFIAHSAGSIELETQNLDDPGPGEILVWNRLTAMSPGTERASLLDMPNTPAGAWPRRVGYSGVGDVIAVGPGVDLTIGTRVLTVEHHASVVCVTTDRVRPIDSAIADEDAAFHRLLQITLQGVRKARIEIGETVLVIGAGLIGSLAAQFAYAAGAAQVLVADTDPVRRALVDPIAGLESIDPATLEPLDVTTPAGRERILTSPPGGPAVVFECTGSPAPIATAFELAGHLARVVLLASTRGITDGVNFYRYVHKKGLTVIGAHDSIRPLGHRGDPTSETMPTLWSSQRDVDAAMAMVASGRIQLAPLITHRVMPDDFESVYNLLFTSDPSLVGCVFDWSDG